MQHPNEMQLQAFMDGELDDRAARRMYSHLHQCAACRAMLDAWERLATEVRDARPATDSFSSEGDFWARWAPWSKPWYPPPSQPTHLLALDSSLRLGQ